MTSKMIFAGFGGQGVLFMGVLAALTGMRLGKNVTYLPAYGAEVRGGTANCTVVLSDEEITSPVSATPDYAVILNNPSLNKYVNAVKAGGTLLLNSSLVTSPVNRADISVMQVPGTDLAHELGDVRSTNVVMIGALAKLSGFPPLEALSETLAETNLGKKAAVLEMNRRALQLGAENVAPVK